MEMQREIPKIFFDFQLIALELVPLNTSFYREKLLFIGCHYVKNSLKISDTAKTKSLELIFFQSDQEIGLKYYRADFSNLSDTLTC